VSAVGQKRTFAGDIGMTKEVTFEPINELVDDAYRAKYRGSRYLKPMIGARTRAATVRVIPR
jgi:hypothetical protein